MMFVTGVTATGVVVNKHFSDGQSSFLSADWPYIAKYIEIATLGLYI